MRPAPSPCPTTVPAISCPKTIGGVAKFSWAHSSQRSMWTSVPHTLAASTRTSSSPGPGRGIGTSRMAAPGPGASLTSARMVMLGVLETSASTAGSVVIAVPAVTSAGPAFGRLWTVHPLLGERDRLIEVERVQEQGAVPGDHPELRGHLVESGDDDLVVPARLL